MLVAGPTTLSRTLRLPESVPAVGSVGEGSSASEAARSAAWEGRVRTTAFQVVLVSVTLGLRARMSKWTEPPTVPITLVCADRMSSAICRTVGSVTDRDALLAKEGEDRLMPRYLHSLGLKALRTLLGCRGSLAVSPVADKVAGSRDKTHIGQIIVVVIVVSTKTY